MIPHKTLTNLEWNEITKKLKENIHTSSGLTELENLKFAQSAADALAMLEETGEFKELIKNNDEAAFLSFSDIIPSVKKTSVGGTLEPSEIYEVLNVIAASVKIKKKISADSKRFLILSGYASQLFELPELVKSIKKKINDKKEVTDDASFLLKSIKNEIASLNLKIIEKIKSLMTSSFYKNLLQDQFYTIRNERYVLPFKADIKVESYGILHDTSQSGQTFFIEPKELIPLNNRLKALERAREIEIERILKELSEEIASNSDKIIINYNITGKLDFIGAKARLSILLNGVKPFISTETKLKLLNAKHPLMLLTDKKVIPNDIFFPEGCSGIIITGPNAGGKTVALKTLGLLILFSHSGIEIPASDGSNIPFVKTLIAEIGDEQSISSDLSTFSAHILSLVSIFELAEKSDFVLLDEVISATDPKEGEALAKAIILELLERGVNVAATTHYSELKALCISDLRLENASVEFDELTLKPTYRLKVGIPGRSYAFDVAASLGLEKSILTKARSFISEEVSLLESTLAKLEKELKSIEEDRARVKAVFQLVSEIKEQFINNVAKLTKSFDLLTEKYKAKLKNLFQKKRNEITALIEEAQKRSKEGEIKYLLKKHSEIESKTLLTLTLLKETESLEFADFKKDEIAPGKRVWVQTAKQEGSILEAPDDKGKVLVAVGSMKLLVEKNQLKKFKKEPVENNSGIADFQKKVEEMQETIDLRGFTSEEAVEKLDYFLDKMSLTPKNELIVIHGHGTGAVKRGVRNYLKESPYVKNFHPAPLDKGGDGATIVILK